MKLYEIVKDYNVYHSSEFGGYKLYIRCEDGRGVSDLGVDYDYIHMFKELYLTESVGKRITRAKREEKNVSSS